MILSTESCMGTKFSLHAVDFFIVFNKLAFGVLDTWTSQLLDLLTAPENPCLHAESTFHVEVTI